MFPRDPLQPSGKGFLGRIVNPLGVQMVGALSEGVRATSGGFSGLASGREAPDLSPDYVFQSKGRVTADGYEVKIAIPFRSLRFPTGGKEWGFVLQRIIPRLDETSYWPRVSSKIDGRMNQAATLNGFNNISPGRNIQLIPYGQFRSFRALNTVDPNAPFFQSKRAEFDGGLDAKLAAKADIIIMTYEKLDSLLRSQNGRMNGTSSDDR